MAVETTAAVETGIVETDDFLAEAKQAFELARDVDRENRMLQEEDMRFVWLREQWPAKVAEQRRQDGRPCLTLDKTQSFIRQVVNDARMNKPQIKVKPVDSSGDPKTAEIYSGLIRNIEYASDADVAYDTAMRDSVSSGRGYFKINTRYATDDTFDQDIVFERVSDPLKVWGDPNSTAADSSDWNCAFEVEAMTQDEYEKAWPDREVTSWDDIGSMGDPWWDGERVMVLRYWKRELVQSEVLMVMKAAEAEPLIVTVEAYERNAAEFEQAGATIVARRPIQRQKVTLYVMSGAEVLETVNWPGSFIPIVPVYGDEVTVDGKRWFSSLIRPAMDAQRNYNYWRSMMTETVALAPRVPFIGPEGAFDGEDAPKWATANTGSHAFISYTGNVPPQRQPPAQASMADMQMALTATDDMKSILGLYDASLGARSNETSGVAINARKKEGDVSTFHFIDNLSRAIKHAGRIIVDLIPHVYSSARMIRTLGLDGDVQTVAIAPEDQREAMMQKLMQQRQDQVEDTLEIYDLANGKYDVAVDTGPSFTTQREESREIMIEILRALPDGGEVLIPRIFQAFDFAGADEIADELKELIARRSQPQQGGGGPDPAMMAEMQMKQQEAALKAQEAQAKYELEAQKLQVDLMRAETERIKVMHEIRQPTQMAAMPAYYGAG